MSEPGDDVAYAKQYYLELYQNGFREDRWHRIARQRRSRQTDAWLARLALGPEHVVVHVGAGDLALATDARLMNFDLAANGLRGQSWPVVAQGQALPLRDASVDGVVCIGSVVNYGGAGDILAEIGRVLRPGGFLILDYESSWSFEHAPHGWTNGASMRIATHYRDETHHLWVYSPRHMAALLAEEDMEIEDTARYHLLSSLVERLLRSTHLGSYAAALDAVAAHTPARHLASHVMCLARKRSAVVAGEG